MSEPIKPTGPELSDGVAVADVPEGGILVAQARGEPVLLVKRDGHVYAVGAACSHYGAPLADGAVVGHELRCPWHHASFDVRTGEAVGPPGPRPIDTFAVVREGDRVKVTGKNRAPLAPRGVQGPSSVVIVGAGAAGDAAAEMLRRLGYTNPITMISRDGEAVPVDRPNLSKDYLDGTAPEEWIPLRGADFYAEHQITLMPRVEVKHLHPAAHEVELADGQRLAYGALLLATGASAIRLDIPGAHLPHVHVLRSLPDSRAVIAGAKAAKQAVVLGSSFIGLEVAASLRKRGLEVHVVSPDAVPLARVLGPELGAFIQALHTDKGVHFHLGRRPAAIDAREVTLDDGTKLSAQLVVMGVGVRANTQLAEAAGLKVDRGVVVDAQLRTSAADVLAAGDIARFPVEGGTARIEHWSVAQQQGQLAARTLLGMARKATPVPFFWSQHYDVPINYAGHAERWDSLTVAGNIAERNCLVAYREGGRIVAVASIYRDRDSLLAEDALSRGDQAALEQLLRSVS
jgi:NADPH-dependent 2,4-dienoyl-CoA reductase/sulfur reductase-like enzyme/nitrite reductase/ring-hydroxylating ferredoxin subunit